MNQQILSQDAKSTRCSRASPAEPEGRRAGGARRSACAHYDLASQERIVRGRMPTMEIINERFARNVAHRPVQPASARAPRYRSGGIKVQKYCAFLREIVVPTNFNIMSVRAAARRWPDRAASPNLVFAVIDSLFGGVGKFHTRIEGRDFSPTEQRVIHAHARVPVRRVQEGLDGHLPAGARAPALGDAAAVRQHRHAQRDRGLELVHVRVWRHQRLDALVHPVRRRWSRSATCCYRIGAGRRLRSRPPLGQRC